MIAADNASNLTGAPVDLMPYESVPQMQLCNGTVPLNQTSGYITDGSGDQETYLRYVRQAQGAIVGISEPTLVEHGNYGPNMRCRWVLTNTRLGYLRLTFVAFSTERRYDYVLVWEGNNQDKTQTFNGTLLGTFSGNPSSEELRNWTLMSTSGVMTVEFFSDATIQGEGFIATFAAQGLNDRPFTLLPTRNPTTRVPSTWPWQPTEAPTTAKIECSGMKILSASTGRLGTNQPAGFYGPSRSCGWYVNGRPNRTIQLSFQNFSLEQGYDFVYVYEVDVASAPLPPERALEWVSTRTARLMSVLTGSVLPLPVIARSGMIVVFMSDVSVGALGFCATYEMLLDAAGVVLLTGSPSSLPVSTAPVSRAPSPRSRAPSPRPSVRPTSQPTLQPTVSPCFGVQSVACLQRIAWSAGLQFRNSSGTAVPTTLSPLWGSWINRYRGVDEPATGVNSGPTADGASGDDGAQISASSVASVIVGLGVVMAVYWARLRRSRVHPNRPHGTAGPEVGAKEVGAEAPQAKQCVVGEADDRGRRERPNADPLVSAVTVRAKFDDVRPLSTETPADDPLDELMGEDAG